MKKTIEKAAEKAELGQSKLGRAVWVDILTLIAGIGLVMLIMFVLLQLA